MTAARFEGTTVLLAEDEVVFLPHGAGGHPLGQLCHAVRTESLTEGAEQRDRPSTRIAVRACWQCPARAACLDYAIAADERAGVWGETLPAVRKVSGIWLPQGS